MTSLCLTDEELQDLTDTPVRALQIKWLTANGWQFALSRLGKPKVARGYFERRMGVVDKPNDAGQTAPDWTSFEAKAA